jgi:hypothetical protein
MAKARRFEGSKADQREDRKNSKRLGMSLKQYERSPQDRKADVAGQRALDRKGKKRKKKGK